MSIVLTIWFVIFQKGFKKRQLHYSMIEQEALALGLALQHSEVYLSSSPIQPLYFQTTIVLCCCLVCRTATNALSAGDSKTSTLKSALRKFQRTLKKTLSLGCKINSIYRGKCLFLGVGEMLWPRILGWYVCVFICVIPTRGCGCAFFSLLPPRCVLMEKGACWVVGLNSFLFLDWTIGWTASS